MSTKKKMNVSKMRFHLLQSMLLNDTFPPASLYHEYKWAQWEARINQGHDREEEMLEKLVDKFKAQDTKHLPYDPTDVIADDYWQLLNVTIAMRAALIVAIWSDMEHTLKSIIRECDLILKKKEKALQRTGKFCKDSLSVSIDQTKLNRCIKDLKLLQSGLPYQFHEIKAHFKKEFNIKLDDLAGHAVVDAIRILNNSFKHSGGKYIPEAGKPQTKIQRLLCDAWGLREGHDIDYDSIPVEDLVTACRKFCEEVLSSIQEHPKIIAVARIEA